MSAANATTGIRRGGHQPANVRLAGVLLALALITGPLAGCGQSGPLYLPTDPEPTAQEPVRD